MTEFGSLGEHCAECHQQVFLPRTCDACGKYFCMKHIPGNDHSCDVLLCDTSVVTATLNKKKKKTKKRSKTKARKKKKCEYHDCKHSPRHLFPCKHCKKHYCSWHLFPILKHNCLGETSHATRCVIL